MSLTVYIISCILILVQKVIFAQHFFVPGLFTYIIQLYSKIKPFRAATTCKKLFVMIACKLFFSDGHSESWSIFCTPPSLIYSASFTCLKTTHIYKSPPHAKLVNNDFCQISAIHAFTAKGLQKIGCKMILQRKGLEICGGKLIIKKEMVIV